MRLIVFSFWLLIVNATNVQDAFPILRESYVRELSSLFLAGWALIHSKDLRNSWYWLIGCALALYISVTVYRSMTYDLISQWKLLVRLLTCYAAAILIPVFFSKISDIRRLFLTCLGILTVLGMSGPIQEITGPIWWMNDPQSLANLMRGGHFRYASIFGDPNTVGIVGACLPLTILVFENRGMSGTLNHTALYCLIVTCSLVLVIVAMSFTGLTVLCLVAVCLFTLGNSITRTLVAVATLFGLLIGVALQIRSDKISTVLEFYLGGSHYEASSLIEAVSPHYIPHWNPVLIDLDYRLFAYLERNNTTALTLFGDSYDTVVPTLYFNPDGILAHNGYKEMYLAGGLLGLGLLLWFVGYGVRSAIRVLRESSNQSAENRGIMRAVACTYLVCSCIMIVYPIFHYPGVAALMWVAAGSLQAIHVNLDRKAKLGRVEILGGSAHGRTLAPLKA